MTMPSPFGRQPPYNQREAVGRSSAKPAQPPSRTTTRSATSAALLTALLMGSATLPALAQNLQTPMTAAPTQPQNILTLSATATVEVSRDVMVVSFSTTKEGGDANAVQNGLKQALDAALTEARKIAKPGQVDLQAGGFSLSPRYGNKGTVNGWQGSTELVVKGKDMEAIAQLVGRINTMTVASLGYEVSREAREKVEGEVTAQAIARFRAKATDMAQKFGHASFTIREVNVSVNEPQGRGRTLARAELSSAMKSDDSMPVEAGKGNVTALVSGAVVMVGK
jgi:predicted secreted protein